MEQDIGEATLPPWQVQRVVGYIDDNLVQPLRIADLARLVRLSPNHFSRAFRGSFGDPPRRYVILKRMQRAQVLMLSTDASLAQIAADCGLTDQAHLNRLFRKVFGETPAAFRRVRKKAAGALIQTM